MPLGTEIPVFNKWAYSRFIELLGYNIRLFNEATRGALRLSTAANVGDFNEFAHYARIPNLVRRRNAYGSGAVSAVDISMLLENSVKIAAGTPPVNIDPHWWQWIQHAPEEAGIVYGTQLAEDTLADMVAVATKAYVAFTVNADANIGAGSLVYDGTAGNNTLNKLNSGAALFGDRASDLVAWVMHSKVWHDIIGAALTNSAQLFTFGTVKVMSDGLGRPFIMTDQPDLIYTSSGTKYRTLGLAENAVVIEQNNDFIQNIDTVNGFDNIKRTIQSQWSFNAGLKGVAWDKANGGASPSTAAIATGTNWDQVAPNVKDLPGVIVTST